MAIHSNQSDWQQADLLGYGTDHTLRLVVELKARVQTGAINSARQWLQQTLQRQPALYALFITPEFMVLRLPNQQHSGKLQLIGLQSTELAERLTDELGEVIDYAVDTAASLDVAIDTRRVPLRKLEPSGLERVVESWLESCLASTAFELQSQPAQAWLVESGLHQVLYRGAITSNTSGTFAYAFAG